MDSIFYRLALRYNISVPFFYQWSNWYNKVNERIVYQFIIRLLH